MRYTIPFLLLTILIYAGCKEENNYSSAKGTARIVSPSPGTTVVTTFHWSDLPPENSSDCGGHFESSENLYAQVIVDIGGGAETSHAQWIRLSGLTDVDDANHQTRGDAQAFEIDYMNFRDFQPQWLTPDTVVGLLTVSGLTVSGQPWQTATIPVRWIVKIDSLDHIPPKPELDTLRVYSGGQGIYVYWCMNSPGIDYLHIYRRNGRTHETVQDNLFYLPNNHVEYTDIQPVTSYSFWIQTGNSYGLSVASDTLSATTSEPDAPSQLRGYTIDNSDVLLFWNLSAWNWDSLQIARRDTLSDWNIIRSFSRRNSGNSSEQYRDTTAVHGTVYYYKVGIEYSVGTWWSDSTGVWVP